MSDTSKRTLDKSGMPFVDPWVKEPNHQGGVPVDAVFVGGWRNYVGIDHLYETLFLVRDGRQDLLWSLATHSEKSTKQNLAAREGGDPDWVKSKITCGCVGGAPREGTENKARCGFWMRSSVQGFPTSFHDRHICRACSHVANWLVSYEQSLRS